MSRLERTIIPSITVDSPEGPVVLTPGLRFIKEGVPWEIVEITGRTMLSESVAHTVVRCLFVGEGELPGKALGRVDDNNIIDLFAFGIVDAIHQRRELQGSAPLERYGDGE